MWLSFENSFESSRAGLFPVKVRQDGSGETCTAPASAPISFQVGDVAMGAAVGDATPWSGFSGRTFSSHAKQVALHDIRAAAMDVANVQRLLDPTGDAEVEFPVLCAFCYNLMFYACIHCLRYSISL
jgi:hypothetical protein